ncbi:hypothetical protein niasHT_032383 [Heterodera trifolii]|uniref:Uncharacterized protein n=1 Tax=Heterodera trifolii TaxID=157864 RepID=A0ABD2IBS1_9BILA
MQLNAVSVISALLLVAILALSPPFCDGVREEETLKKKSKRPTIGKSPNASPIRKPNALQLAAKKGKQKFHGREAFSIQGLSSLAAEPSPPTPKITDKTLTPANAAAKRSALSSLPSLFDRALQPSSLGKKALHQAFQPSNLGASTSDQAFQPNLGEQALDQAFQPSNFGASTSDQDLQPNLGEHALDQALQLSNFGASTSDQDLQPSYLGEHALDLALQPSNLGESTANQAFQQSNMRDTTPVQALQPSNLGERTSDQALKLSNLGDMAFPQAFQTLNLEQPAPVDQAFQPWNLRPTTFDVPPLPPSLSDLPQLPSFIPDQACPYKSGQLQFFKNFY